VGAVLLLLVDSCPLPVIRQPEHQPVHVLTQCCCSVCRARSNSTETHGSGIACLLCVLPQGHYLLGVALRESVDMDAAVHHLTKALDAAREKDDGIKGVNT